MYLADTGVAVYTKNRRNSCHSFKRLQCDEFTKYTVNKIKTNLWSPDECVGSALSTGKFKRLEIGYTKTIYNYIDLGLLSIKNVDLPLKLRRNTKLTFIKKHKKILGKSISECPNTSTTAKNLDIGKLIL